MTRYLLLGDPVVALGAAALIPDGAPLYQRWYDIPVEPARAFNARRLAGGDRGAD